MKFRYDKTTEYKSGKRSFGNDYKTANNNWYSIHNPITEEMKQKRKKTNEAYTCTVQNGTHTCQGGKRPANPSHASREPTGMLKPLKGRAVFPLPFSYRSLACLAASESASVRS